MARRSVTIVSSDSRREGVSWYEGATEAAVLRCARLALGLPLQGNAHLVWKSGDIVDFDKPITDGVTLYLETTIAPYNDYYYGGGSIGSGNSRGSSSGGGGAIGGLYSGAGDGLAQRRSSAGDQIRRWRSGADDGGHRAWGSVVDRRTGSPPPTVALGGFIHRLFRFSRGKDNSDRERNSDDERRPLLYARSSSAQKLHQEQKAYRTLLVGQAGGSPGSLRGINGAANETCDPEEQRQSLLKLKRILAHLANERTLLAWVRVMGKLFTAGTLSMTLAAESHGGYTVSFFVLGMVYFAMCPYVVFVGSSRYFEAAGVMQGSVHETYSFFAGKHLRGMNMLMSLMAALTVALMLTQLLSTIFGLSV